jgi:hypothetical protein
VDELADWTRDGYIVLPGALPAEPCEKLGREVTSEYERLNDAGWRFRGAGRLAGHLNFRMGQSGLRLLEAVNECRLQAKLEELDGQRLALVQAVGNLNLPGSSAQDFHIDGSFDHHSIIANICLVPSDKRNGATQLVPQSNRLPMSYWRFCRDDWPSRAVQPALNPGDIVIRPSNLWHRGMPNHTTAGRPMAAFVWRAEQPSNASVRCADLDHNLTIFENKYSGRFRVAKEFTAVYLPRLDHLVRLGKCFLDDNRRN